MLAEDLFAPKNADIFRRARFEKKRAMKTTHIKDCKAGSHALAVGIVNPLLDDVPQVMKDYYEYYKTPRGYHPRA